MMLSFDWKRKTEGFILKALMVLCVLFYGNSNNLIFAGHNIDSLKHVYPKLANVAKIKVLSELVDAYADSDSSQCFKYLNEIITIAEENNLIPEKGRAYQRKGMIYKKYGSLTSALDYFKIAGKIFKENKFDIELAGIYNNMGATYTDKGDYDKAIGFLVMSLKIYDRLNNEALKAKALLNIGLLFYYQKNYDIALKYYDESLQIRKKINDKKGIALCYNNMGIVAYFKNQHQTAIINFKSALAIYASLGNLREMSLPLFNIAEMFGNIGQIDSSLVYYTKSYAIDSALSDKASSAKSIFKIAETNFDLGHINQANVLSQKALQLSKEVGSKEDIKDSYILLSRIYAFQKNYARALACSDTASLMKDSLYSTQSSEQISALQTQYETEKKDTELKQQKNIIAYQHIVAIVLYSAILIALILLSVVYYYYKQKKKAYIILNVQKKNITDSINYASRIQSALLPPDEMLNQLLPEHFILYMPKDIVSGDFYWITIAAGRTIIAVADCTGHGVPGAFMSMLGFAYLNEIVNKNPEIQAHEILNELRIKVKTSLHQDENHLSRDGMDIALAIVDKKNNQLQYAGANSPMLICRNGQVINLTPDKMPIGKYSAEKESFTVRNFSLEKGDTIYLFSDGYLDQFGGNSMKKLGRINFEGLVREASLIPIKAQKFLFAEKMYQWMEKVDQMDDILIMGVKISDELPA